MAITKDTKTSKSTQEMQNLGFDTEFNLPTVENLVYNPVTVTMERMVQPTTPTDTQSISASSLPLPTGASTSAKQQPPVTTPTVYNLTLTSANTEYSQVLPANTREFRFICRTLFDIRFAWVTGKVATPTAPYLSLPAGADYYSDNDNLASQTLFLASSQAGVVAEIEVWT